MLQAFLLRLILETAKRKEKEGDVEEEEEVTLEKGEKPIKCFGARDRRWRDGSHDVRVLPMQ